MSINSAAEQRAADVDFDHLDPATASHVQETLSTLRATCPVAHSSRHGGFWVVSRHDDIADVARDDKRFSAKVVGLGAVNLLPELDDVDAVLFEQDRPTHTAWRQKMQRFFTVGQVGRYEPFIRATARGLLAELKPRGVADLMADLAVRVPPVVVAALLGVPEHQREEMAARTRDYFSGGATVAQSVEYAEAFAGFLREQIRDRRGHDGDDVLTWVVNAEVGGKRLSEREALKHALVMVAAGYLTTRDALGNLLMLVAADPRVRSAVTGSLALLPDLIEEVLRYESPVAATGRTVRVPTTVAGVRLEPGERILLAWGSGNRDAWQFDGPDEIRPTRPHVRRHLAWGAGAHRCIGMHLARLELRVVLEEVLRAIPDYRLVPGAAPELSYGVTRGPRSPLMVEWTP